MKKIFCLFALTLFACAFTACNNEPKTELVVEDSMVQVTEDTLMNVVDTVYIDTIF